MPITVLIVDDSKLARIVAGKAMAALQPEWQRVEANDADQAIGVVKRQTIDLALLDYNMPGRNGLELAAELRTLRADMPIAIITANIQTEIQEGAKAVNGTLVSKPITEDSLREFISAAASRLRGKVP